MNADERRSLDTLTHKIIGCAYEVSNELGCGFLEKVYENALAIALKSADLRSVQQAPMKVLFRGQVVGEYYSDLLVEERVLVELKSCKALEDIHRAQCMNYLKATGHRVCLLINFGTPKVQIIRLVNDF